MTSTRGDREPASDARDARRTDTRERILEAATALFREKGYAATSTQNIADALGVTKAALYYHFESKEDILLELKQPILEAMEDVLKGDIDCSTAAGRRQYITTMVETLVMRGAGAAALMVDARGQFEIQEAVERTGVPARAAAHLIAGMAGTTPEKAPRAVTMRVEATVGALASTFGAWARTNEPHASMGEDVRADIVDIACAILES